MFTAPAKKGILEEITDIYRDFDGKRYQLGLEKGRSGYRHIQGRIEISKTEYTVYNPVTEESIKTDYFFETCKKKGIHCEKSENWCDYEGKDGYYITSDDNEEIRLQRFGKLTLEQEWMLCKLQETTDREIMVWHDPKGNNGKSWLAGALWERHKAHQVRMVSSAEAIVKDVCSKMDKEKRPIVIIDIPRSGKWTQQVYEAIEVIKDGLIDDPRYSAKTMNIKGTKVMVMCNTKPKLDKLSKDRWKIYRNGDPTYIDMCMPFLDECS